MRLRNLWQLFRGACCREKRDDHKAHDEGRSLIYDAKKCNAVSAQFFRNPNGTVLYGPILRCWLLAKGIDHSRPRLIALEQPIPQSYIAPLLANLATYSAVPQQRAQHVVIDKAASQRENR